MSQITIGGSVVEPGNRLVYPNGGLVRVKGIETTVIGGKPWVMLVLTREEDGAVIRVMPEKLAAVGLRKVADRAAIELLFEFISRSSTDPTLDWKVRHRENFERMSAGGLLEHAEIMKGLHALAKVRPLPTKERELYDHVRHLLITEIAAAWGVPLAVAENNIDYALNPPPGSGREAPSDEPLDVKKLRRTLGGTRKSVAADEFGLGADADVLDDDAEDEEEEKDEEEKGDEATGDGESDESAAKPPAKPAPKGKKAASSAVEAPAKKAAKPVPSDDEAPKKAAKPAKPAPAAAEAPKKAAKPAPAAAEAPKKAAKPAPAAAEAPKKAEKPAPAKKAPKAATPAKKAAAKKPEPAKAAAAAKKKGGKS